MPELETKTCALCGAEVTGYPFASSLLKEVDGGEVGAYEAGYECEVCGDLLCLACKKEQIGDVEFADSCPRCGNPWRVRRIFLRPAFARAHRRLFDELATTGPNHAAEPFPWGDTFRLIFSLLLARESIEECMERMKHHRRRMSTRGFIEVIAGLLVLLFLFLTAGLPLLGGEAISSVLGSDVLPCFAIPLLLSMSLIANGLSKRASPLSLRVLIFGLFSTASGLAIVAMGIYMWQAMPPMSGLLVFLAFVCAVPPLHGGVKGLLKHRLGRIAGIVLVMLCIVILIYGFASGWLATLLR